jgi:hypothetical protein
VRKRKSEHVVGSETDETASDVPAPYLLDGLKWLREEHNRYLGIYWPYAPVSGNSYNFILCFKF